MKLTEFYCQLDPKPTIAYDAFLLPFVSETFSVKLVFNVYGSKNHSYERAAVLCRLPPAMFTRLSQHDRHEVILTSSRYSLKYSLKCEKLGSNESHPRPLQNGMIGLANKLLTHRPCVDEST